jgi:thiol-disulfide isomerase/thioredoxin
VIAPRALVRTLAAVLIVALASGCGRGAAKESTTPSAAAPAAATDTASIDVRPATLEQVRAAIRTPIKPGERLVLMNVWATWCAPCREEFPDFMRIRREYAMHGVRLMLVSADVESERSTVKTFLAAHGVDFPTFIKITPDMAFIDGIEPRWTGALPATFLYDRAGKQLWFHEGKVAYDTLRTRLDAALAAASATGGGD